MKIQEIKTSLLYKGIKLEIFMTGCLHDCPGCFNPELQDFTVGDDMTLIQIISKIREKREFLDGVVLTGGDPLWNKFNTLCLVKLIREEFPELELWMYTGFDRSEIQKDDIREEAFSFCDVVVTGRYDKSRPKTELTGSDNQLIWRNKRLD